MGHALNPAQLALILLIGAYRWLVSPAKIFLFGPAVGCRFTPSCSEYAIEAVRRHGAAKGAWLALKRLARCHPWGGCGEDPVPEVKAKRPMPIALRNVASPGNVRSRGIQGPVSSRHATT